MAGKKSKARGTSNNNVNDTKARQNQQDLHQQIGNGSLATFNVDQLRQECRKRGLPMSGNKVQLVRMFYRVMQISVLLMFAICVAFVV